MMGMKATALALIGLAMTSPGLAAGVRHVPGPPGAPFSTATEVDGILYLSGEVGVGADGKLVDGFEAQSRQVMDNIAATLKAEKLGMDDVFKCTILLTDMRRWGDFNTTYVGYFTPGRLPARSAIGANGLAMGALIEVECLAKR
jgi:2-iminobutanoate/2-iminopropanoate deaminase